MREDMSRPSIFPSDLGDSICYRLSMGESARQICRSDQMPSLSTLMKWLTETDKKEFSEQYARARDCQADFYADEIVDIADELGDDVDSNERLDAWMNPNPDADFKEEAKRGANEAIAFAKTNKDNTEVLLNINDFEWLKTQYEQNNT